MKAYVLGNENCILGFSLVGIEGQIVRSPEELSAALNACLQDEAIGLLLISADVAVHLRERIDQLKVGSLRPLVVEIPGAHGETPYASLQELVQSAVGVSLGDKT
ncbi:MAG: V-type ATP synthase subunit F [Chloroflexi bacterium]|nr:V-type ATP synthase subunit F [Chloroflexota bacterium]